MGRGRVRGEGRLLETETGCEGRSGEGEEWQEEEGGGEEAQEGMHGGKDRGIIRESRCGGLCDVILYERPSSTKMHATCAKSVRGRRASLDHPFMRVLALHASRAALTWVS